MQDFCLRPNSEIHPKARADLRQQFDDLLANSAGPATWRKFIRAIREAKNKSAITRGPGASFREVNACGESQS
jgi:plasmid stabilization system protein ParE